MSTRNGNTETPRFPVPPNPPQDPEQAQPEPTDDPGDDDSA
jgi:hypothetical protein